MATTVETTYPQKGMIQCKWPSMVDADTNGDAATFGAHYQNKTVQVTGTFGSAGVITLQGSNDGTNWYTLTASGQYDPDEETDDDLVFAAAGLRPISESPRFIRPRKSTADAALDVAVTIIGA